LVQMDRACDTLRVVSGIWGVQVRRREVIATLGGVAVGWPLALRAQQPASMRRIGILHDYEAVDPEGKTQISAFSEQLRKLGWIEGENLEIQYRSAAVEGDLVRNAAAELITLKPEVVLAAGGTIVAALQRASRSTPIIFVNVTDPVGGGLVASLARPGGNTTGFTQFEFGLRAKWLEILKQIAPVITRVGVIRDPAARSGGGQLGAIQVAAPTFRVDLRPIDARDADEIEQGLTALSRESSPGLIVTTSRLARVHRGQILSLAARYRIPAIYAFRVYVSDGGLMSYGPDAVEPYRRAASYVDRILKGEKAADMPVQAPTKYELAINLKTAKALGLTVPEFLLARADDVIE
jgi:putative ABC transport system substrate-binding protein